MEQDQITIDAPQVVLVEDVECSRLNKELEGLASLRGQLQEQQALTRDIALEHQSLTGDGSLVSAYFSTGTAAKKFSIASEGLLQQTQTLLKKAKDLLWSMIVKVYQWLSKLFSGKQAATEAAIDAEFDKFKRWMGPVERAERVPSSRTAILQAVREVGLDKKYVSKFVPEEMDIYNEGAYHHAVLAVIPTLKGFDVYEVVSGLEQWHKKTLTQAVAFDNENGQLAPEVVERKLEQFKADATRTLESTTQMSRGVMDLRLKSFQQAQEARRKLRLDPNFHLGTDLSGIMKRGARIFEQSGYKQMGSGLLDVQKGLTRTVEHLRKLQLDASMDQAISAGQMPGQQRLAEEFVEQTFMKEVNRIISTLNQCVQSVQMLNNYYSFVVSCTRKLLAYVREVAVSAVNYGGDQASLGEVVAQANQHSANVTKQETQVQSQAMA